jgi:hypothetical protein
LEWNSYTGVVTALTTKGIVPISYNGNALGSIPVNVGQDLPTNYVSVYKDETQLVNVKIELDYQFWYY